MSDIAVISGNRDWGIVWMRCAPLCARLARMQSGPRFFFCVRVHVQCKGRGRHMNVLPPCCVSKILTAYVCAPTSEFDLEYCEILTEQVR